MIRGYHKKLDVPTSGISAICHTLGPDIFNFFQPILISDIRSVNDPSLKESNTRRRVWLQQKRSQHTIKTLHRISSPESHITCSAKWLPLYTPSRKTSCNTNQTSASRTRPLQHRRTAIGKLPGMHIPMSPAFQTSPARSQSSLSSRPWATPTTFQERDLKPDKEGRVDLPTKKEEVTPAAMKQTQRMVTYLEYPCVTLY